MIRIVLTVMAAAAAALSYRLLVGRPCRVVSQVVGSERRVEGAASVPALTTVLSMLEVAMRQGASVPPVDIATMVRRCAGKDERVSHVRTVADELAMACRLSASLGCGAAR